MDARSGHTVAYIDTNGTIDSSNVPRTALMRYDEKLNVGSQFQKTLLHSGVPPPPPPPPGPTDPGVLAASASASAGTMEQEKGADNSGHKVAENSPWQIALNSNISQIANHALHAGGAGANGVTMDTLNNSKDIDMSREELQTKCLGSFHDILQFIATTIGIDVMDVFRALQNYDISRANDPSTASGAALDGVDGATLGNVKKRYRRTKQGEPGNTYLYMPMQISCIISTRRDCSLQASSSISFRGTE